MKVCYGIDNLRPCGASVVTVGSFDGVHRGHRVLIDALKTKARELDAEAVVVTFGNHPRGGRDGFCILSTVEEKLLLLEDCGVDRVVVLPFDQKLRDLSAVDFVEQVLCGALGAVHVIVGYDHRFGRGKEGDVVLLEECGRRFGFGVTEIGRQMADGLSVNSTEVRAAIGRGDVELAARLLGHPYVVCGEWQNGTVVLPDMRKLLPPRGIYPIKINQGTTVTEGVANIAYSVICIVTKGSVADGESVQVMFGC